MFYRGWIKSSGLKVIDCYGDHDHWTTFESCRKKHNDNICEETNKLVLRLDKFVEAVDAALATKDKKAIDLNKSANIEWMPDDLVKLCPYCAKTFTFARRKHHCRLCGAILCNSCSGFLEYQAACKLVKPAKLYTDPYDRIDDRLQTRHDEERPKIRLCEDCKRLLDKRLQTIEDHYCQAEFLDLYDRLRRTMAETDELLLSQSSLSNQTSPKGTAMELKSRIQELRQSIASMSNKLKRLAEKETRYKLAYLLKSINQSVVYWLSEGIENKANRLYGPNSHHSQSGRSSGWVADQPNCSTASLGDEENPLMIQIRMLDEYIRQAKSADRYDEVSALEASKRDIEIEYFIQQDLASVSIEDTTTSSNEEVVEDR